MDTVIQLQDAFKTHTLDQDKIISPEETVRRFKERATQLKLNILNKTERIDNGRLDIPVFFSECGSDAKEVTGTNKQMGKGGTPEQSEASAVMELAERFSFFSFKNNPDNFITAAYADVASQALPFSMILQSVHDEAGDQAVLRKIFETLPLKWTKGFNLTRGREVLIPFDWFYMINEFNGPSAGNCREEAICQGICEIVERHTSSLISHGRLRAPAIDPASATDPMVRILLDKYAGAGIVVHISDFTLGMGIPTVGVLAHDPATFPAMSEIVWTAGTAPDPQKAMSRALTETAQLAGDFNTGSNYVASGLPKFTSLEDTAWVSDKSNVVGIRDLPDVSHNNIRVEVERCVASLADRGMDVLLINTMHPGLGIPAFYTIVPGAHFRERAVGASLGMFAARMMTETLEPGEAIRRLNHMERLMPGHYYTRFYLGLNHLKLDDPRVALGHLEKALSLDPARLNIPDITSYMGVCLKDMGEYERAIGILKLGEAIDEQRTDLHNLQGFCHFKMKRYEKAIACFEKVIALDPGSAIDYANIASNYRELGNSEKAVDYYSIALKIDPDLAFARENLERLKRA
ncbi:MAG: YcaO-like family protein [Pseudomonadota bacterium]